MAYHENILITTKSRNVGALDKNVPMSEPAWWGARVW